MYTFDSKIRYSETDSGGKLTMASLLNYFQDCSTFQSEELGVGLSWLQKKHRVWVLSSWQIVVERYPDLCEEVRTGTFPYDFKGFLGYRNFFMTTKDGEMLAKANSLWSLLDTETGRPAMADAEILEKYALEERLPMEYASRKIAAPKSEVLCNPVTVKKHHLDTNHHVNNGQFVDIAMEFLPADFVVKQLRAEYRKQAFLNDVLYPYVSLEESGIIISLKDVQGKPYAVVECRNS